MDFSQLQLSPPQALWLILLAAIVLLQGIYYFLIVARTGRRRKASAAAPSQEPVSVVVCAKNEYHNLSQRLPILLEQDYRTFEVVVVNDASTDETEYFLKTCEKVYPHLKVVNMPQSVNFFSGKKYPLSIGIKSAKYDIILLTDADCIPNSLQWISKMAAAFTKGIQIVLGYGGYERDRIHMLTPSDDLGFQFQEQKRKQAFGLNVLIQYDTLCTTTNMVGFSLLGMPYMGVGRNLAYRRSLFFAEGGFIKHYRVKSGDDDLFVNTAANPRNTAVVTEEEAFTYSAPKQTYSEWIRQKKRHLTTGKYYKTKHKLILSLYPLSIVGFYALFGISLLFTPWYFPVALLTLKIALQIFAYYKAAKKLRIRKIYIFAPLLELFFLFFNTIVAICALNSKSVRWK